MLPPDGKTLGLVLSTRSLGALTVALLLSGCLDRSRLNTSCAWIGDTSSAALDPATAADRRHLANDVRIAGENATRYRDSAKVHFGYAAAGRLDEECLDRLSAAIGAQHRVRRADIDAAAGMRDVPLDVALVYIPVGGVFLFISLRLCRWRFRRLPPPGERWTVLVGVAWLGLLASPAATAIAYLHSWNVDTVRLRDFHISFRAAYLPIGRHPWLTLLVAIMVFGVASVYEYRAARQRPADHPSFGGWQSAILLVLLSLTTTASVAAQALPPQPPPWRPQQPSQVSAFGVRAFPNPVQELPGHRHTVTGLLVGGLTGTVAAGAFLAIFCSDADTQCGADEVSRAVLIIAVPPTVVGGLIGFLVRTKT